MICSSLTPFFEAFLPGEVALLLWRLPLAPDLLPSSERCFAMLGYLSLPSAPLLLLPF